MTVAVVTPWRNHMELGEEYLRAIEQGPPPDELIIIDNGSDPPLRFARIHNPANLGFCRACNQGLKWAKTDVVVFLNNDVRLTEAGWLQELVDAVEPSVLAGARLRDDQHTVVDGRAIPYLDGWCLAGHRTDLLELGGWDESLEEPAYYSDNILSLEAVAAGMTLREARVGLIHLENVTSRDQPADLPGAMAANRQRYEQRARQLLTPAKGA